MNKKAILFSAEHYYESHLFYDKDLNLPVSKHDVFAMNKRLKQIGFEVTICENSTKSEFFEKLQVQVEISPEDSIHVVYFSGHGGHFEGDNYVYPVDFTTTYELNRSIDEAAINIKDIISIFGNKGRLILIIDACRDEWEIFSGNYSEMATTENVYIAYATMFSNKAFYDKGGLSWFTEAICDEILYPNIDVDSLFTNVRRNVFFRHGTQIPSSVNALLEPVFLNERIDYDPEDKMIYDFVEKYGDEYNEKYGYFQGDDLIFIDAAQFFGISLLDTIWKYKKVNNVLAEKKGIKMPALPEKEQKIVTFLGFIKSPKYFSHDISHTWYYNGRQIRMGEIPPLPPSMQRKLPEEGKELCVLFKVHIDESFVYLKTNLPNGVGLSLKTNLDKAFRTAHVKDGMITICKDEGVSSIQIDSTLHDLNEESKNIVGTAGRNLVGGYVEYHPIYGNQIIAKFEVDQT